MDGHSLEKAADAAIDVLIDEPRWEALVPDIENAAHQTALLVLAGRKSALCILLTSDAALQALNAQFRGKDRATNVLSFPAAPGAEIGTLGDIALALETVEREAKEQNKPFLHHAQHLIVHGVLHLLGYDHETEVEARVMEALETKLLATVGIANPYQE